MIKPLFIVTAFLSLPIEGALFAKGQPNVIYVFPDQFRNHAMQFWGEEGFKEHIYFKPDPVHTPNLNSFARESVVLTSAQSNYPVSSPHRGMLLTGMYPHNTGVSLNCNSNRPISSLRVDATTISDVFSKNNYDCAYIGKYHLDYPTRNNPQNEGTYVEDKTPVWDAYTPLNERHGFNYWYSYGTFDVHKSPHYWDSEGNRHEVREWSPQHEADKVIEYLKDKRNKDKPFFLVWSINPPHSPYNSLDDCMEEDYNLYKDISLEQLLVRPNINPALIDKQKLAPYYFASVTGVDREFGRVLAALKELDLDENTIVVFSSDHGETMASHVLDAKNSPYSEAMNIPFLIRYPNVIKPNVSDMLLSTADIMPTLLSMAGLNKEIPISVQGEDLSVFLKQNTTTKEMPDAVLYIKNSDGEKDSKGKTISYFPISRGVKTERYTLSITIDKDKKVKNILFFDDQNDPYQMKNISIDDRPADFRMLCTKLALLLKKTNDPWYKDQILSDWLPYNL